MRDIFQKEKEKEKGDVGSKATYSQLERKLGVKSFLLIIEPPGHLGEGMGDVGTLSLNTQ